MRWAVSLGCKYPPRLIKQYPPQLSEVYTGLELISLDSSCSRLDAGVLYLITSSERRSRSCTKFLSIYFTEPSLFCVFLGLRLHVTSTLDSMSRPQISRLSRRVSRGWWNQNTRPAFMCNLQGRSAAPFRKLVLDLHITMHTGSLILQDNVLDVFSDPIEVNVGFSKKNQNAARPSEHLPVRGKNVKTFRWDHRLQIQNLFMVFKRVPRLWLHWVNGIMSGKSPPLYSVHLH